MTLPRAYAGVTEVGLGDVLSDGTVPMTGSWNFGAQNLTNVSKLLIGTTTDLGGRLQVVGALGAQLTLRSIDTDNTNKDGTLGVTPRVNSQVAMCAVYGATQGVNNLVRIGGGLAEMQAATQVAIYAASAVNTTTGTSMVMTTTAGLRIQSGAAAAASALLHVAATGNANCIRANDSNGSVSICDSGGAVSTFALRVGGTHGTTGAINANGVGSGLWAFQFTGGTNTGSGFQMDGANGSILSLKAGSTTTFLLRTQSTSYVNNGFDFLFGSATTEEGTLQVHANPAATPVDTAGFGVVNTTAATVGAQKYSPVVRWRGNGWKTDATAASQSVEFRAYAVPVQGAAAPSVNWVLESSINAASYVQQLSLSSAGYLELKSTTFGLAIPKIAGDPATIADGDIWYNTSSNKYKGSESLSVRTFTTT